MTYTKESLYKAYAKHTRMGLDELHVPGTDEMCAVCDEIKQINADLEAGQHVELIDDQEQLDHQHYQSKVFEITETDGSKSYVRITRKRQADKLLKNNHFQEILPKNFSRVYLLNDNASLISLQEALTENPKVSGLIGRKENNSIEKGFAKRNSKQLDRYIRYTGDNAENVFNYIKPLKAAKTKKGNKIQINTPQGSIGLQPNDYLIKLPNQRLLRFTTEEFQSFYIANP